MIPYYIQEKRRAALAAELAGWEGTRFWPRVAVKGRRADCIQFATAVQRATGAMACPVEWPRYSVRQWPGALAAIVAGFAAQGNWREFAPAEALLPGDVLVARLDDGSVHTGVLETSERAWHCFPGSGVRVFHPTAHHLVLVLRAFERLPLEVL